MFGYKSFMFLLIKEKNKDHDSKKKNALKKHEPLFALSLLNYVSSARTTIICANLCDLENNTNNNIFNYSIFRS